MNLEFKLEPDAKDDKNRPLADRMRPSSFDEILGQNHILGENTLFSNIIKSSGKNGSSFPSIIFWGSAGCGKTTIARLIANHVDAIFISISAISSATADLRKIFTQAESDKKAGKRTLLLIDEIHRFNRSQQDLFLPYIENGTIILIGATTENPSFELNSAILSRCKVLVLNRLDDESLTKLTLRAEDFLGKKLPINDDARLMLANLADGDGRYLLNICEDLFAFESSTPLNEEQLLKIIQKRNPIYDKSRDGHYNLISALHKSLRGSDANASLYWFARMTDGGDDPLYIARRLIRFASEDVGLADPNALTQALAAKNAYEILGSPEGELAIAQAICYLATAPKSNAIYSAFKSCMIDAKSNGSLSPPKHIMNAPTKLMKDLGHKEGYIYDHDTEKGFSGQDYFPEEMDRREYYTPVERGFERDIKKRLDYWDNLRKEKN